MASQAKLEGSITISPGVVTDSTFPAGSATIPLAFTQAIKTFNVDQPLRRFTGTGAPQAVSLGVTSAEFLYVRTQAIGTIRFNGGTDVPIHGTFIMEFPTTAPLTALSITVSGTVEYAVGGS